MPEPFIVVKLPDGGMRGTKELVLETPGGAATRIDFYVPDVGELAERWWEEIPPRGHQVVEDTIVLQGKDVPSQIFIMDWSLRIGHLIMGRVEKLVVKQGMDGILEEAEFGMIANSPYIWYATGQDLIVSSCPIVENPRRTLG